MRLIKARRVFYHQNSGAYQLGSEILISPNFIVSIEPKLDAIQFPSDKREKAQGDIKNTIFNVVTTALDMAYPLTLASPELDKFYEENQ